MNITFIGIGQVGSALAGRLVGLGHLDVLYFTVSSRSIY
jgi:3-hydroxyisobutyrate dehydrogenase-like beta-hydroxyacid dehydrogenase